MSQRFVNQYIREIKRSPRHFFKWACGLYHTQSERNYPKPPTDFAYPLPQIQPSPGDPTVVWLGHSTFLLEVEGVGILTDPVFSDRCSPLPFAGPLRRHAVPMSIEQLPTIDAVFISHNHYDHLDKKSVMALHARFPEIRWFVPFGVKKWFSSKGIHSVTQMQWWQNTLFIPCEKVHSPTFSIHFVPSQHHSGRSPFDQNRSLWGGFVIEARRYDKSVKRCYFVGDTGYHEGLFGQIKERFAPIDLLLCPIGTYVPDAFMKTVHIGPKEAVKIHQEVGAKLSLGMHWLTFKLSDEHVMSPPYDLFGEMLKAQLDPLTFLAPMPGVVIPF